MTSPTDTAALGERVAATNGVRTLAHVAGVGAAIGDWRTVMEINLIGPHRIASAIEPHLVRGAVGIFVSSIAARLANLSIPIDTILEDPPRSTFPDDLVLELGHEPAAQESYNLVKLGVMFHARNLAVRWGAREARAISLSPGMIDSAMGHQSGGTLPSADGTAVVDRSERVKEVPQQRLGSALEVARVLALLASEPPNYVNGIDVLVDGGLSAAWRAMGITA